MGLKRWLLLGDDPFLQLEELCGHRWRSHVMIQLLHTDEQRFAELAVAIRQSCPEMGDGQLDRTIKWLLNRNLIRSSRVAGSRHRTYALTPKGRQHADRLCALLEMLDLCPETLTRHVPESPESLKRHG